MSVLGDVYGDTLIVRPPVPATLNKAGANYKSEVAHLTYSPRRAYDEWLSILDGILACGGDAVFDFEAADDPYLDHAALEVRGDGAIVPAGSQEVLGRIDDVMTGRVFAANGPWVTVPDGGGALTAVMPNMLAHRRGEAPYYRALLERLAEAARLPLTVVDNPHRWEGMADVAVVGERVVLTYAVPGHYDQATAPKTERSSRAGVAFAADASGVPAAARVYAELVYPHFHGDTVHFGARPAEGAPVLVHYAGGLWGDGASVVARELGRIVAIDRADAVDAYAGNSRQVAGGVLVPGGVSDAFLASLRQLGLAPHRVPLFELFGKAGGGPACATLYLPRTLELPRDLPQRYSVSRSSTRARRERIPEVLRVDRAFFEGRARG
ncbi:MAG: hypothetical protein KF773_25760 [Deltaproteobacteria bacterium]|nr:hypothetical protein [Deltaproteobacteria bacterium]